MTEEKGMVSNVLNVVSEAGIKINEALGQRPETSAKLGKAVRRLKGDTSSKALCEACRQIPKA